MTSFRVEHTGTGDYHVWDSPSKLITLGFLTTGYWQMCDWHWYIESHQTFICCPWIFYSKLEK